MSETLQDDQYYFFRLKPTGVCRDWRVGHVIIENDECQLWTIGSAKPMIVKPDDLTSYDFVSIERPGTKR